MSLRSLVPGLPALCLIAFTPFAAIAQQDPAPAPAPPPAAATQAPKQTAPDYPDPRTFTVGIYYWITIPGNGPDLREGKAGTAFGTLNSLGGDHRTPGVEISMPVTRTGVVHFEGFLSKGDGKQIAPADTTVFAAGFNKGDSLSTQYQITAGKLYLEDLLHPFKFPLARFRLKSLWEVQYISIKSTIDAPAKPPATTGGVVGLTGTGSRNIIFPTFGLAAEYDLAPHLTFRVAGSGFGLPHRAEILDAEATLSYRRNHLEIVGGAKALHFKTSPKKDEYVTETLDGGFVGLRWHF